MPPIITQARPKVKGKNIFKQNYLFSVREKSKYVIT